MDLPIDIAFWASKVAARFQWERRWSRLDFEVFFLGQAIVTLALGEYGQPGYSSISLLWDVRKYFEPFLNPMTYWHENRVEPGHTPLHSKDDTSKFVSARANCRGWPHGWRSHLTHRPNKSVDIDNSAITTAK
jgi:hypothetical protein